MVRIKSTIIDANVWIAYYKQNDSLHRKALAKFKEFKQSERQCVVTNLIVSEVYSILTYAKQKKIAEAFIIFCLNNERIIWLDMDRFFIEQINNFAATRKLTSSRLSLVDYSIIFLAQEFDFEIFSFDQELLKYNKLY